MRCGLRVQQRAVGRRVDGAAAADHAGPPALGVGRLFPTDQQPALAVEEVQRSRDALHSAAHHEPASIQGREAAGPRRTDPKRYSPQRFPRGSEEFHPSALQVEHRQGALRRQRDSVRPPDLAGSVSGSRDHGRSASRGIHRNHSRNPRLGYPDRPQRRLRDSVDPAELEARNLVRTPGLDQPQRLDGRIALARQRLDDHCGRERQHTDGEELSQPTRSRHGLVVMISSRSRASLLREVGRHMDNADPILFQWVVFRQSSVCQSPARPTKMRRVARPGPRP